MGRIMTKDEFIARATADYEAARAERELLAEEREREKSYKKSGVPVRKRRAGKGVDPGQ